MEKKTKLWYFENFNLLESLNKKEMEYMSKTASMRGCTKNQIIYFPEDSSNVIYFLKQGKVKISRHSEEGKEIIITILGPGEIFGELSISGEGRREEIAEALEESIICALSIQELEKMMEKNPKFNIRITKFIGIRLKKIESRLASLIFKSTENRIKSFIKEMADDHGTKIGIETEVKLNLTHDDIAKLTATSRQSVTSVFNELEKDNVILYNRKRILIKDYEQLAAS